MLGLNKADDAVVSVGSDDFFNLRFEASGFTANGGREDVSASVTVWIDKKRGSASANDLDDTSLRRAVEQAEQLARISPVDREYLPTLGAQAYKAAGGYVEATANPSPTERAKAVDKSIRACEREGVIGAGLRLV